MPFPRRTSTPCKCRMGSRSPISGDTRHWQVLAVSQPEELLKVMVANPAMIEAYRAGVPGNGKPFPDGSKIAKIEWKPKKSTESPFSVRIPENLQDLFFIEKDT